MRSTAEPHSETAQLSQLFSPGCGYRECQHCAQTSPPPPPPLPPKPPWLRPSRPLSFSTTTTTTAPSNNSSLPVCDKIPPSETSASSETSEQEPVIYSKNVKLGHHDQSSQVGLKGLSRKVIKHKSATVNLENLLLEKYLREKETKKNSLEVRAEIFIF